jgi:hypothetical protein
MANNHLNKDWLYDQYVKQEVSIDDIAKRCGVTRESIIFSLDKFEIYRDWKRLNKKP